MEPNVLATVRADQVQPGDRLLTDAQRAYIDGLRQFADWLEQHPGYPPSDQRLLCYQPASDNIADVMADAARALSPCHKEVGDAFFYLTRQFGGIEFVIYSDRDAVCERVVVGTETVMVTEPDPDLLAAAHDAGETRTEEREIVEWRCPDSLLRGNGTRAAS